MGDFNQADNLELLDPTTKMRRYEEGKYERLEEGDIGGNNKEPFHQRRKI